MDGAPRILTPFPEELSQKAERSLAKLGVEVKTGVMVKNINPDGVTLQDNAGNARLDAKTVIWAGGVTVPALGKTLATRTSAETDKGGRIKVTSGLTIPEYPDIYVVGDLASSIDRYGKPLPGVAQVAMQQGAYAAKVILRKIKRGKELAPFEYFDKGSLAVIGRAAAVANVFGVKLSGLPAWVVWAFIHLMYIVEFQSRILVFIQWAFQDLTFSRGARLITGSASTDFNFNREIAAQNQPDTAVGKPEMAREV
jgi:NADH dehydrogenase